MVYVVIKDVLFLFISRGHLSSQGWQHILTRVTIKGLARRQNSRMRNQWKSAPCCCLQCYDRALAQQQSLCLDINSDGLLESAKPSLTLSHDAPCLCYNSDCLLFLPLFSLACRGSCVHMLMPGYTLSVYVQNNPRFSSSLRNITGESVGGSDKLRNSS